MKTKVLALMLVLPLLFSCTTLSGWDNPLAGTIYDRDLEGIPRVAWIDIGRIMQCVQENELSLGEELFEDGEFAYELWEIRKLLHQTVFTLRQGKIKQGTDMIYSTTHRMGEITRKKCSYVRGFQ